MAEAFAEAISEAVVTLDVVDRDPAVAGAKPRVPTANPRTGRLKWVVGLLLGQTAIIAALVKLL